MIINDGQHYVKRHPNFFIMYMYEL